MSEYVGVHTQTELDEALKRHDVIPICVGDGLFMARESSHVVARRSSHVVARESSHVEARESSHVEAWESSHVEAWESSHVVARGSSHVVAWGSSHVVARESSHVVARESSHVVARESSHVEAWGSSHVEASRYVSVHQHGDTPVITGGVVIVLPTVQTIEDWCDYWDVSIRRGRVTLFKAVGDDYVSSRNFAYTPGTRPVCPDWDPNPQRECGGGLHLCAAPHIALSYRRDATRFVACPVRVTDLVVVPGRSTPPDKVRASRIAGDVFEVDEWGEKIA